MTLPRRTVHDAQPTKHDDSSSPLDESLEWGETRPVEAHDVPTAVGEALRFIQMTGVFYCPSELTEPWGLALPPMDDCVWFHAVTEGTCTLEVDGVVEQLGPGDIVVVPHGTGHRAWGEVETDTPIVLDLPHEYVNDHYAILRYGGGGPPTRVVCGGIRFEHPAAHLLVAALPPVIRVAAGRPTRRDSIRATIDLIADEVRQPQPGGEAVISRLCDIVVIQAIRSWIDTEPAAQSGWLGALRDPQIGAAMARVHAEPEHGWSVASLAEHVSMSRSAFAARFTELVGEPVMAYVTNWRMHVALDLLRAGELNVGEVAARVGYDSEASFSRAFKRVMGRPPRTARTEAA